jgi:hypothetical protein
MKYFLCSISGMYGGQENWNWGGNVGWNAQNQGWGMPQQPVPDSKVKSSGLFFFILKSQKM